MGTGSLPEVKWLGCGANCPHTSTTEVTERVELFLYSPSVPAWQVIGRTFKLFILRETQEKSEHFH
jgi:hypothetical protein